MFLEKEVHPVSHDPGLGHGQLVEILAVGAPVSEPSPSRNLFRFLPIQHAGLPQVRAVGVEPRLPGKCHAMLCHQRPQPLLERRAGQDYRCHRVNLPVIEQKRNLVHEIVRGLDTGSDLERRLVLHVGLDVEDPLLQ